MPPGRLARMHSVPDADVPAQPELYSGHLEENACRARYGVAYLRSICSQAGVMLRETDADEDAIAIDCALTLDYIPVPVQVKCTTQFTIKGSSASWRMDPKWHAHWSRSHLPVYFVLVVLDEDQRANWLTHSQAGTHHSAAAYWTRVDALASADRIHIDKRHRLTTETFHDWEREAKACFIGRPAISNAG
jgi:hypothetical protein